MNSLNRELLSTMNAISGDSVKEYRLDVMLNADQIIKGVCDALKVDFLELMSESRKRSVTEARQIAMYIVRNHTELTLKAIGYLFNRDHSTVIFAIETIENLLHVDKVFRARFSNIFAMILNEMEGEL